MSELTRTWLTGKEFQVEYEQRRAETIARQQTPQPASPSNPATTYELRPRGRYVPNRLDSSGYPGTVVYRRSVVERTAAVSERGAAAPVTAAGLLNGHISSPDVFNPFDKGHIEI